MPDYTMAISLSHNATTGAGLAVVERRYRFTTMTATEQVWHVHILQRFPSGAEYAVIRERIAALLDTRSLKDNTRLAVEITGVVGSAMAAFYRAGVRAVYENFDRDDGDTHLWRYLTTSQVLFQNAQIAFAPNLDGAEQVRQEFLDVRDGMPLRAGRALGSLALAVLVAQNHRGYGEPRPLSDDPMRDRVRPLDLRPAPSIVLGAPPV